MVRNVDLLVLSLVAAAMAVYLVITSGTPGGRARESARVVPEQRQQTLEQIAIERPEGPTIVLERDAETGAYRLTAPVQAPVDQAAVDNLTGTLEILRARRSMDADEVDGSGLDAPRARVKLDYDQGGRVALALGAHLAASDSYWLARNDRDRAYLIAGHAGRALDRTLDDLRSRRPLRTRHRDVTGIEIDTGEQSLILSGRPLAVHLPGGGKARIDAGAADALLGRLDDLRIVQFADAAEPAPENALSITVSGEAGVQRIVDRGACPGRDDARLVTTPVGSGCIAEVALAELAAAVGFTEQLVDRHLVATDAGRPHAIEIQAGDRRVQLEAEGGGWKLDGQEVDSEAVVEWARALDELGGDELTEVPADAPVQAAVELEYQGGRRDRIELVRAAGGLYVRRAGEPLGFAVGREASELMAPQPARFGSRQLWALDPTSVRSIARGDSKLVRGELLEDWSVNGREVDSERAGELAAAVARPRALQVVAASPEPAHRLSSPRARMRIEFAPPLGSDQPIDHELVIGAATDEGCYATADREPIVYELPAETCQLLLRPWQ